jgi:molybdate transport system substrate-binding protein
MKLRPLVCSLAGCLALTSLAACGGGDEDQAGEEGSVTIRVFAAASLTESFTALGTKFEKAHPGKTVELNFGPSSGLAEQIASGAPADVFASASPATMDSVVKGEDAEDPETFATNSMEIAVPADNPRDISTLEDLSRRKVKVAVCQAQVPCGEVAAKVFANAGITVTPVTEEIDVKSVLTKVSLDEVDAGIVYVTDVRTAGDDVKGIEIPAEVNATTTYPIATLTRSEHERTAQQFVDLVLSEAGAKVLEDAGFAQP